MLNFCTTYSSSNMECTIVYPGRRRGAIKGRDHPVLRWCVKVFLHFIHCQTDSYHGHNNFAFFIAQNLDLIKSRACVKCSEGTPNPAEKVVANRKKIEKEKKSTKSKYINSSCCNLNAYYVFGIILGILCELILKRSHATNTISPILQLSPLRGRVSLRHTFKELCPLFA